MTRKRKILTVGGLTVVAIAALAGGLTHCVLWGMDKQFDDQVYKVDESVRTKAYSHLPYAEALKYVDDSGMVYYAGLKANRGKLDEYVRAIAFLKPEVYEKWDKPAQIAFLTNAYNALTLKLIIDRHPIKSSFVKSLTYPSNSIRQIPGAWDKVQFLVMGKKMTLEDIEHKHLRATFNEPRIHMALVCAAMSCPPLRNEPYYGSRLAAQLDDQTRKFLASAARFSLDRKGSTVHLSKIFEWFGGDFTKTYMPKVAMKGRKDSAAASLNFVARSLSAPDAKWLRTGDYSVKYLKYDWKLNERKTMPASKRPVTTQTSKPARQGKGKTP